MHNYLSTAGKRKIVACNTNAFSNYIHIERQADFHVLILMTEGEWEIWQDDCAYTAQKHDILFFHASHRHYGRIPCAENTKTIFLHCESLPDDVLTETKCTDYKGYYHVPALMECRNASRIHGLMQEIVFQFHSNQKYKEQKCSAVLDMLLCELSENSGKKINNELINKILPLFNGNPHKMYTIPELAQEFKICEKTLTSQFKAVTGETIHKYQLNIKLQMAQELIDLKPELTLKELAASLGFYDEYHFSKCYKAKFGYSPKRKKF